MEWSRPCPIKWSFHPLSTAAILFVCWKGCWPIGESFPYTQHMPTAIMKSSIPSQGSHKELIPWNRCLGSLKVKNIRALKNGCSPPHPTYILEIDWHSLLVIPSKSHRPHKMTAVSFSPPPPPILRSSVVLRKPCGAEGGGGGGGLGGRPHGKVLGFKQFFLEKNIKAEMCKFAVNGWCLVKAHIIHTSSVGNILNM